ncbi:uncharacterized protein LOC135347211 [Halichondria panicea]|uniref:uncharacterized protein LOC135347211 n=1 Tax=Halichondria panicea TaxID=6063 RepID=UPI00312B3932
MSASLLCPVECGCLSGGDVLGVRASAVAGELLVSRGGGQIQVLNMERGVCVKSWQLSTGQSLSTPAVQHPTSRDYWAITNSTDLLSWQFTDTSLTQSPQGLFSPVHCLLVTRSNKAPLAVLRNGSVCVAMETVKAPKNKTIKVEFAHVLTGGDKVCVVCRCETMLRVDMWAVNREGVSLVNSAPLDKDSLTSFCVSKHKLLAADTEGRVYSWCVGAGAVVPSTSLSLSRRPIRLQINTLSSFFVTNNGKKLSLWEPVYMTKQAEFKVHGITTVHSCGEWVCGVSDDGVSVWRVEGGNSGLVGALDKTTPQQLITVATWDSEVVSDGAVLDRLADRNTTPTLKRFMAEFSSCPLTSDLCYSHLVERLLEEKQFWARAALETLIKAGTVPSSLSDHVLREVVLHKDWELLCLCLEEMTGFSEATLVAILEQLISPPFSTELTQDLRHTILTLLLCQPFNDALLQQPLSQLSPSTVRDLLGFVSSQLTLPSLLTQRPRTYNALLDWAAQILDVHFTQLTFDPTCRDLLVALQVRVRDQVVCWGRLACVRGAMDALTELANAPTANGWLYKLETMDIDL